MSVIEIIEIPMPRLSDAMEEGTILSWLKASGDAIAVGEPIVEIETDKATMEYEAEASGVLEILAGEGETISLGQAIARLLPEGMEISDAPKPSSTPPLEAAPAPDQDPGAPAPVSSEPVSSVDAASNGSHHAGGERVLATPVARRMAVERGLDLAAITPTGHRGQIVKADVEAHAPRDVPAQVTPSPNAPRAGETRRVEISRLQKTVARRMTDSRTTVPDFEVSVDIDMGAALALRSELKAHLDPVPSVNDMIIRACALSLREHPRVNGAWREEGFDLFAGVNVGIAVAADDALMVAVVPDTDQTPLSAIAVATRRLAERARSGEITPAELSGATFTVSNLGMFGIDRFSAIINQPQAAILAVGAITERAVVRGGAIVAASIMTATLAADHRILYGADGARFITDVRDRLQAPLGLLAQ